MIQEIAEHESSWLIDHSFDSLGAYSFIFAQMIFKVLRLLALVFVTVLFIGDSVLARMLIQLPLHKDVKE